MATKRPTQPAPSVPDFVNGDFVLVDFGYSARMLVPAERVTPLLAIMKESFAVQDSDHISNGAQSVQAFNAWGRPAPGIRVLSAVNDAVVYAVNPTYRSYIAAAKADAAVKQGTEHPVMTLQEWLAAVDTLPDATQNAA